MGKTMIEVLHSILTDASARSEQAVASQLTDNSAAGFPWFDEA